MGEFRFKGKDREGFEANCKEIYKSQAQKAELMLDVLIATRMTIPCKLLSHMQGQTEFQATCFLCWVGIIITLLTLP